MSTTTTASHGPGRDRARRRDGKLQPASPAAARAARGDADDLVGIDVDPHDDPSRRASAAYAANRPWPQPISRMRPVAGSARRRGERRAPPAHAHVERTAAGAVAVEREGRRPAGRGAGRSWSSRRPCAGQLGEGRQPEAESLTSGTVRGSRQRGSSPAQWAPQANRRSGSSPRPGAR